MNYIFDFDGTIADSMPAMIAVYNKNIRGNNNPLTPSEIETLRGMSSRKALKNLGVRWWQIPKLLLVGLGDFHAYMPGIKPFRDMQKVIKTLHNEGHMLFIVTSNTTDNVNTFLEQNKLEGLFTEVYGSVSLFKKASALRKVVKSNKLKKNETIYIGDETRDVKAAKLARIKVLAVTWGLNSTEILRKSKPHYLVDFPNDLLKIKLEKSKK